MLRTHIGKELYRMLFWLTNEFIRVSNSFLETGKNIDSHSEASRARRVLSQKLGHGQNGHNLVFGKELGKFQYPVIMLHFGAESLQFVLRPFFLFRAAVHSDWHFSA